MASKRDYYEVLGVSKDAGSAEIKKAYKKLALANHPDRNQGDEEATLRFKEAAEAFEVLGDDQKRAVYDRYGHAGLEGGGSRGFSDLGDIFDAFGDMFDGFDFFGGGRRSRGGQGRQGDSLQTTVRITLHDAAFGCNRSIQINRHELCGTCSGSGAKPGTDPESCDYCGGRGQVLQAHGIFRVQTTCPSCRGQGSVIREKCSDCRGSGREAKSVDLDITIPPGVDTGMRLRVSGEGEPGAGGGPRGDLFVSIEVESHDLFERDEIHLTCHVPISYAQAALGTEIEVPLLDGRHNLSIPGGTQPGHVFEIRHKGMPDHRGRGVGNLYVRVDVEVPRKLGERQEELLRELAELEHTDVLPRRKSFFDKLVDYFSNHDENSES